MTFAAMPVWGALLLVSAAAAAAAALFLMKLRPPRVPVPSLLLWRRVLDEARELTFWERIRRAVSLAITILIALVIALAITRPAWTSGNAVPNAARLLIMIDSSWSMLARTRSGETRWERALAEGRRLAAAAGGTEIALATTADGLVEGPTTDTALIESALDRLQPGGDDSRAWPRLAAAAAVHFVTDGAVPRRPPSDVIVHSVYDPAPNVAVTALDVRPSLVTDNAGDAYVEIGNFADAQKVRVTLTRGQVTIFDRDVEMASSEILRQVVPLDRGADRELRVRVQADGNALDADDEAVAWLERAKPRSIVIVGEHTDWLRDIAAGDPGIRATFVHPTSYVPGNEDVAIYVNWAPPEPPTRPALLFAPPLDTSWLGSLGAGAIENGPHWEVPGSHPVVQGVDPFTLSIQRARHYSAPTLVAIARSARGTPLVCVSEAPERRLVVVTFGADESNLAGAPGFPVLVGNALDWLANPAGGVADRHRPGLIMFGEGVARVTGPEGTDVPLVRVNRQPLGMLRQPGFYTIEGGGAQSTLSINAGDAQLSNLTRAPSIPTGRRMSVDSGGPRWPLWVYFALAAFVLILAEWWTWGRRITV